MIRSKSRTGEKPAKVMIVDDHPLIIEGLTVLISTQSGLEVCGNAADVQTAMEQIEILCPELVITEITLTHGHGIDFIKEIKLRFPGTKLLVSSMHDEDIYAERTLRAGALGYIQKEATCRELLEAVHCVLADKFYVSAPMRDQMLSRAFKNGIGLPRSPIGSLTNRELQVFELIGAGRTKRAIADRLSLSVHTIDTYREKIKTKLDLKNAAELASRATLWVNACG